MGMIGGQTDVESEDDQEDAEGEGIERADGNKEKKHDDIEGVDEDKEGTDKFAGVCLYSRFKSYYDWCVETNEQVPLEQIHEKIIEELTKFSAN